MRTELGDIDVIRIDFFGEISLTTEFIPVTHVEYIRSGSGESIAQSAAFELPGSRNSAVARIS